MQEVAAQSGTVGSSSRWYLARQRQGAIAPTTPLLIGADRLEDVTKDCEPSPVADLPSISVDPHPKERLLHRILGIIWSKGTHRACVHNQLTPMRGECGSKPSVA